VFARVLGVAAGGGFPQWNCACRQCAAARAGRVPAAPHAALAVSADGRAWHLVNATPDVAAQIEAAPPLHPGPGARETPVAGVVLTDAEFDHTIGLLVLREGSALDVYGTPPVLRCLEHDFPVRRLVADYAAFRWHPVEPDVTFELCDGLRVTLFPVADKPPRYTGRKDPEPGMVAGCRVEDPVTGGRLVWAPQIGRMDGRLRAELDAADCALADGTFWTEHEMAEAGVGATPAAAMGHLPLAGPDGLAAGLAGTKAGRKLLVHVNNTNPVHDPSGPERRALADLGVEVAHAGLTLEL
jgi:pyrroloquinoline quinone biosynthesis protein B